MTDAIVVIGAGSIGQAIARRVSAGKRVLLADLSQQNADAAAKVLNDAGFEVSTATVGVSSRESVRRLVQTATGLGGVSGIIHAAGVSPTQALPARFFRLIYMAPRLCLRNSAMLLRTGVLALSSHRSPVIGYQR